MSVSKCSVCDRAWSESATRCACGLQIDWLRTAPEALRAKLRRAARSVGGAAVITTMGVGCSVGTCAALDGGGASACSADVGCAARLADSHVVVDAGTDDASH